MWFWWFVILPLAAVASGLVFAVEQSHRAGHRYAPRHLAPLVVGEDDPRFGSMSLVDEPVLHHEQDQSFGTHFMLHGPAHRDPVCFWCGVDELERAAEPGWREQTMADLSPAALDPGPGVVPSHERPPGPAPSGCVVPSSPKIAPISASSPGNENRDRDAYLGPRASAVLERYERSRQERWALA